MDDDRIESAIERVRGGDVDAFGEVVRACEWSRRGWIAARCPPEVDPDEVAHLAFIQAFSHLGDYTAGTRFRSWLWTIARNQLLSEMARPPRRDARAQHLPEAMREALGRELADDSREDDYL